MLWVAIFLAIAVIGAVMVVCYGVWLAHKAADVLAEVVVLTDRGASLAELLGQIAVPAGQGVTAVSPLEEAVGATPHRPLSLGSARRRMS